MKFKQFKIVILAAVSLVLAASAQAAADTFAGVRTVVLDAPRIISGGGASTTTNSWSDIRGFEGIAKIDFSSKTNVPGGTLTALIQTSDDQTNITTMANAAFATRTTVVSTNYMFGGTNLTASTVFNLPGVLTIPTPATAGWATPYILANPFTNTVSALSLTADGVTTIGFNIADTKRYVRIVYTTGGTDTNSTVSATLTGLRHAVP